MDAILKKEALSTKPLGGEANVRIDKEPKKVRDGAVKTKEAKSLARAINFIIYALIFTVPLFFLPFTFEFYIFNKLFLLFFGVTLLFLLTVWKFFKKEEIEIVRTPLDFPLLTFIILALSSSIFSFAGVSSFLGFYGRFSGSFMEIFLLALFFWLIVQNWGAGMIDYENKKNKIIKSISLIFLSNFFVSLFTLFSLFDLGRFLGEGSLVNFLRFSILSPTGLTLQGLAVYFAANLIFLSAFLLTDVLNAGRAKASKFASKKIFYYLIFVLNFVLLALIDFWVSWVILMIGLGIFLAFAFAKRIFQERSNLLVVPIFIFLFSAIFLVFNVHSFLNISVNQEVLLSPGTSIGTIAKSFISHPFLGSGPGNFWYDFNSFKGEEFLSSPFWQLRFSRSHFGFLEHISGLGAFGFLALVVFFGMFFLVSSYFLKKLSNKNSPAHLYFLALFIGLTAWFLVNLLYADSTVLNFYLWVFLGLAVVSWKSVQGGILKVRKFSLSKIPELSVVFLSLFIILIFVLLAFWWQGSKVYLGDVAYRQSFKKDIDVETRINYLAKATRLSGNIDTYFIAMSQHYLNRAVLEINKPADARDFSKLQESIALAIQAAKRAAEINPNSVSAWENLGEIYRDLGNVTENAFIWSENSFNKAIALEPANPFLYISLAKAQMVVASGGKEVNEEKINEAVNNLEKARALKEEYVGAYINKALVFERRGNIEEALKSLEDYFRDFISLGKGFWKNRSELSDFFFQLGRFYYNKDDLNKAAQNFIQAINLVPLHANARYSLAVTFEKQGMIDKALKQFEIVLRLNPDNAALKQKIKELQASIINEIEEEPEAEE